MTTTSTEELQEIMSQIQKLLLRMADLKDNETHLEKLRLLKLVDAELIDALYNLNQVLGINGKSIV